MFEYLRPGSFTIHRQTVGFGKGEQNKLRQVQLCSVQWNCRNFKQAQAQISKHRAFLFQGNKHQPLGTTERTRGGARLEQHTNRGRGQSNNIEKLEDLRDFSIGTLGLAGYQWNTGDYIFFFFFNGFFQ